MAQAMMASFVKTLRTSYIANTPEASTPNRPRDTPQKRQPLKDISQRVNAKPVTLDEPTNYWLPFRKRISPFKLLNDDILTRILSHSEPREVWRLATTSRKIYAFTLPFLLSHVDLKNAMSLVELDNFLFFVHTDLTYRAGLIKSIKIGRCSWYGERIEPLAQILRNATDLGKLHLVNANKFLATKTFHTALVEKETLKDIHLGNCGKAALPLLIHCKSKLLRLTIDSVPAHTEFDRRHVLWALKNCEFSLQTLHLLHASPFIDAWTHTFRVSLHHVREVTVTQRGIPPSLSMLSDRFPKLQTLNLDLDGILLRENETICWEVLDYVRLTVPSRYLTCAVRHLHLDYYVNPEHDTQTRKVLEATAPSVLTCRLADDICETLELVTHAVPNLRYIEIEMSTDVPRHLDWWADVMAVQLCVLPLYGITVFSYHIALGPPDTAAEYKFAHKIASWNRKLRFVGVYLSVKQTEISWYSVLPRTKDQVILRKLPLAQGFKARRLMLDVPRQLIRRKKPVWDEPAATVIHTNPRVGQST